MTYNFGLLKSWKESQNLADFSHTRRQLKNYRLEKCENKIRRSEF